MHNLSIKLKYLLPDLDFNDIGLWHQDGVTTIVKWDSHLTQPTQAELEAAPENDPVADMIDIRAKRDSLLASTDWRFRSDQTPSQAWIDYCQALRDLPANTPDPVNPTWPTEPGE